MEALALAAVGTESQATSGLGDESTSNEQTGNSTDFSHDKNVLHHYKEVHTTEKEWGTTEKNDRTEHKSTSDKKSSKSRCFSSCFGRLCKK